MIPPIIYYGGKGKIMKQLLMLTPYTKIYCEVYGGSGGLLFRRRPSQVEVYNDINKDLFYLMKHLQDKDKIEKFQHRLEFTLNSYSEFCLAVDILKSNDASEEDRAWAFFVGCNQGFNGKHYNHGEWSRTFNKGHNTNWIRKVNMIDSFHKRLKNVQIDSRDALEVIKYWDSKETTFYLDPPYVADTRRDKIVYKNECTDDHYEKLIELLLEVKGNVVLSGYESIIYNKLVDNGWDRIDIKVNTSSPSNKTRKGKAKNRSKEETDKITSRVESIWRNPKCVKQVGLRKFNLL